MAKATTNKEFLKRCVNIYNNKYDYSKVNYIKSNIKIIITCHKHGDFEQLPLKFLNGRECSICKKEENKKFINNKKLDNKEFIKKSKKIFGDKYGYSKVKYVNYKTKITLECSRHGDFEVVPNYHLSDKSGCQKCAKENIIFKNTINQEDFIKKAIKIHKNKYDYSKLIYKKINEKIKIICKKHGEFEQTPLHHIHSKSGCPKCGFDISSRKIRITNEDFIERSKLIHKEKYDYSLVKMNLSSNKVIIICPKHGKFKQIAMSHLIGQGCPICKESFGERNVRNWLEENNINFERQKKFDYCKNKRHLPFDFYIPQKNLCIEFNGIQHYQISTYFGEESFKKTQINDKIKKDFCKENNIKLLIIKYNENISEVLKNFFKKL